jgi:hypothetical protein
MGVHISLPLPIVPDDLRRIEDVVWNGAIFVPGNFSCNSDFGVLDHHLAHATHGSSFHALYDRNLVSPLVSLVRGDPISSSSGRVAAAAAAFCILANILIEPSIALYEYASKVGADASKAELAIFRIADNIAPQFYVDIALGRANRLPQHEIDAKSKLRPKAPNDDGADFSMRLRFWKLHYFQVLRIATLIRQCESPLRVANEFIKWQLDEAFFDSVASMYCLAAISHRPPKGGMIDAIRSKNTEKFLSGLRRATWDIYVINHFGRLSARADQQWALWSLDKALVEVARWTFIESTRDPEEQLSRYFRRLWGDQDGRHIACAYAEAKGAVAQRGARRQHELSAVFSAIDLSIANLEGELGISATR